MFKSISIPAGILLLAFTVAGCGPFTKAMKDEDPSVRYKAAQDFFEKKEYRKALQLFETIQDQYKTTGQAERVDYMYAYCVYQSRDYEMASYLFERFIRDFPKSSKAEEADYLAAYCAYKTAPVYNLEPSNTDKAIGLLQRFIERYPDSENVAEADKYVRELRGRLEKKSYEIAMLFMKLEDYESAIISFRNTLSDYPDTRYREQAMYNMLLCAYRYARGSIFTKQVERYTEAQTIGKLFTRYFPESRYSAQVETLIKSIDQGKEKAEKEMAAYEKEQKDFQEQYQSEIEFQKSRKAKKMKKELDRSIRKEEKTGKKQ